MDEISENLEQSIRRSNNLVKSVKHKMEIREKYLTLKEKIHIHGLYTFMQKYPEVSNAEIYQTIKGHPLKFWLLKDLCKEDPSFLKGVRDSGFWYACTKIEQDRSVKKKEQTENAQL